LIKAASRERASNRDSRPIGLATLREQGKLTILKKTKQKNRFMDYF